MADTFAQLWRRLLVYSPKLPIPLAQEFINNSYARALRAYEWYGQREDGTFNIPAPITAGTIDLTKGSTTVAIAGFGMSSDQVGMQLLPNRQAPVFTIVSINSGSSFEIDNPWTGESQTAIPYEIVKIYVEMPSDFYELDVVVDPTNRWRLHTRYQQKTLDYWDAARTMAGTPWTFAAAKPDPTTGAVRYELWPRLESGPRVYGFRYRRNVFPLVAEADTLIPPLTGDIIREGALAELSLWKGTEQEPNPAYDPQLASIREGRFIKELNKAELVDQNMDQTRVTYWGDINSWPWAPFPVDAAFFQRHGIAF